MGCVARINARFADHLPAVVNGISVADKTIAQHAQIGHHGVGVNKGVYVG
jgi:hypothetical protein